MEAAGHRRRDAEPGGAAGTARLGHRRAGLRRPGQLDRPRHLLAGAHRPCRPAVDPTVATMAWALAMGVAGALLGWVIRWIGLSLRPVVHLNRVLVTAGPRPAHRPDRDGVPADHRQQLHPGAVLRPGRPARAGRARRRLLASASLILLAVCKTLAYGLSLSAFRGGPVFPSMFIGAALGIAAERAARDEPGAGDRDGHRRHVRRDAAAAVDLDAAGHPAARRRRRLGHPAGRRRGGGGLRHHLRAAGPGGSAQTATFWWAKISSRSRGISAPGTDSRQPPTR